MIQRKLSGVVARGAKMAACPDCGEEIESGGKCPNCGPAVDDEEWQDSGTGDDADPTAEEE